mgnify:CR=1 FL=1
MQLMEQAREDAEVALWEKMRDEHGMTEYDRFMDDNSYWNQNHYEEYAPRFVDKIHNEVLEDLMTPEQVEEEFTLKNVSLHIVGTLTINPDCY